MQIEAAHEPVSSDFAIPPEKHVDAGEHIIELDEDLFPWDGSDDLDAYVDKQHAHHFNSTMSEHAAEPAWRRIERYRDRRELRNQLQAIQ